MKKTGFFVVFFVVLAIFLTYGCNGRDYNEPVWTMPTFTPTGGAAPTAITGTGIYVVASVSYNAGISAGTVQLQIGSSSGTAVSGATVTMNGQALNEVAAGTGAYMVMPMTGLAVGTTINLIIISPSGNATGTIVVPATGVPGVGTITGGAATSVFAATSS